MPQTASDLIYARDLQDPYETRHQHARAARRGTELRVARGVYLSQQAWQSLQPRERYLMRVRAVAETRRNPPVVSHWSAAAIHGLSIAGTWPATVHTTAGPNSTSRSRGGVVRHIRRLDEADVTRVDGILVTSVSRTVLDIAAMASFRDAVTMADSALHVDRFRRWRPLTTREELLQLWERTLPFRGHRRCRMVIQFAQPGADTPIESISRVNMWLIGCPQPLLQIRFSDHLGVIGDTDFYWKDHRLIGEADGDVKYLDPRYRGGRSADEVVLNEKVREDRLRGTGESVTRWRWRTADEPSALRRHLVHAGLPMGARWVIAA